MPILEFCCPTHGKAMPSGPEWFHEIKYDGYRQRLERDGDRMRPRQEERRAILRCDFLEALVERGN